MKKTLFYGLLIAVILASLVNFPGQAQEAQASQAKAAVDPAISPWHIGWADKNTSANVGAYPSVAYNPANGIEYISYYDAVNGNLMLTSPAVPGTDCGTNVSWWCRAVDGLDFTPARTGTTKGDVGRYSSIAFWQGPSPSTWKLGISYHDTTNNALKYAEWSPSTLTNNGWTFSTIESSVVAANEIGTYTSLKFSNNGSPVIAYYSHWEFLLPPAQPIWFGELKLAWPTPGGNCGPGGNTWTCDIVDSGSNVGVGQYASLDYDYNNNVHMSYYDGVNQNLKYANFVGNNNGNCGASNRYECTTINQSGDVGLYSSLVAPKSPSGHVSIAYYDKTGGNLKYAEKTSGTSGTGCTVTSWNCSIIAMIGANLLHTGISMALDSKGNPIIAYENAADDRSPATLSIARPASAIGQFIGNCGPAVPTFYTWQCDTLDNAAYGQGYVNLASYTAIAVSPTTGLATIAYLETDDSNTTDYLKVAYQQLQVFLPLTVKH